MLSGVTARDKKTGITLADLRILVQNTQNMDAGATIKVRTGFRSQVLEMKVEDTWHE